MTKASQLEAAMRCSDTFVLAINDTLNVLSGKWKVPIIASLSFGKKRFKEMERHIPGINPRMLSKELKDLEANGIVKRTVYDTVPVAVEYELTTAGETFKQVLDKMIEWGIQHRKINIGKGVKLHRVTEDEYKSKAKVA
jgi:DNA-binding HxlR family transcriptional regulator